MQSNTHNSGVYALTNVVTGRQYIGSSRNLKQRLYGHLRELSQGRHYNFPLQSDYTSNNDMQFDVIEHVPAKQLRDREQYHIDLQNFDALYNVSQNARGGNVMRPKAFPHVTADGVEEPREACYFLAADGITHRVTDVEKFCADNGLLYHPMKALYYGRYRQSGRPKLTYKGWQSANPELND